MKKKYKETKGKCSKCFALAVEDSSGYCPKCQQAHPDLCFKCRNTNYFNKGYHEHKND